MSKIRISHENPLICESVSKALLSLDNMEGLACETMEEGQLIRILVNDDDDQKISSKSYEMPVRIGRIMDDIAMILRHMRHGKVITMGDYNLDAAHNMLHLGDENVRLTDRETEILVYLHDHHGNAASKNELLEKIWDYAEGVETHTLETHIYRLRQKIAELGGDDLLLTEEDGYRLNF